MSIWDWLGPLNAGKRAPWDFSTVATERKLTGTLQDFGAALTVNTMLVHGPGASELLAARRGDDTNSAVFACLQVIATALAEPPLRVYRVQDGDRTELDNTPLGNLLAHPNPHISLSTLLAYLSNCLHVDGNAYWRKLRAGNAETGNVVELWPISPSRIEPRTTRDSGDYISFYRYYIRPGRYEDILPENIVHFRQGVDDHDHRVGCAPLKRLMREISSDEQATRYADRLLSNLAINGLSVEWEKDTAPLTQPQAEEIKARIQSAYSGDNVGAVSVMSPGAKLVSHGFSPEQMDMKTLHRVPEERIAAVLGVPAIVAGLGAGLDRSTYSNFAEAREAFTEMKLLPFWRALGDTLTMSLVPNFTSDRNVSVAFMIDDVRALQDDQNAKATRLATYVASGILTVDEARAEIGHEPLPEAPAVALPAPGGLPPATRSRLLALPQRKAADDLPARFGGLRDEVEPDWRTAMQRHLDAMHKRVAGRLRAGTDADGLVPDSEGEILGETLRPLQAALLKDVHALVLAELGIDFQLDDPLTREFLKAAGVNIKEITEHTRERVIAALTDGQAAGEGISELAARLRDLPAFGEARARVVARTELGHSQIEAAYANYVASGVVDSVRILDGDFDAACAARNGRVVSLREAASASRLLHPNCTAAWLPVVAQEASA